MRWSSYCIGEPISWLRLEQHAMVHNAKVAEHLEACEVCRGCFRSLDAPIALPRLIIEVVPRRRWSWIAPSFALAAAAVIALVLWQRGGETPQNVVAIKGGGELVLGVVRERHGAIAEDVHGFLPGDRWKLVVTCPPAASTWLDAVVFDGGTPSYPLQPAHVTCGNRVVVPGAFTLTGAAPNRVCVRVSDEPKGQGELACVTIRPE